MTNRRVWLKSRPTGEPKLTDFEIADAPMPTVGDGEILCRTIYLSLDLRRAKDESNIVPHRGPPIRVLYAAYAPAATRLVTPTLDEAETAPIGSAAGTALMASAPPCLDGIAIVSAKSTVFSPASRPSWGAPPTIRSAAPRSPDGVCAARQHGAPTRRHPRARGRKGSPSTREIFR